MRATSFWWDAKPMIRYRAEKIFRKQGSLFQIGRMAASHRAADRTSCDLIPIRIHP
jgi:hypothetical protein